MGILHKHNLTKSKPAVGVRQARDDFMTTTQIQEQLAMTIKSMYSLVVVLFLFAMIGYLDLRDDCGSGVRWFLGEAKETATELFNAVQNGFS